MLNFGDLFYVGDKEYVWLFSDGERIYAAIILDSKETRDVKALEQKDGRKGVSHNKMLYCYVELSTEDYIDYSANMISTQKDINLGNDTIRHSNKKLNNNDVKEIKKEILESENLFKQSLVEFMKSINL